MPSSPVVGTASPPPAPSPHPGRSTPVMDVPKPNWMKVSARPASEPKRAACVRWRRYVRRNPGSWKNQDMRVVRMKVRKGPVGRSSIIISPLRSFIEGTWTVVSQ